MGPKLVELRPNRDLLDAEFNGYKLSVESVSALTMGNPKGVDRALPHANQYSLLHAKLFGLHNHLVGETTVGETALYFVDKQWAIQRSSRDAYYNMLTDLMQVWQVPNLTDRQSGDYNVCLRLISPDFAAVSDGAGMIYVLLTGEREDCCTWDIVYSDEILGPDQRFVIIDTAYRELETGLKQINLLLLSIAQEDDHFLNVVNWVTLNESNDKTWGVVALRGLKGKGELQYCRFDQNCAALYVVSENGLRFTIDSENPINDKIDEAADLKKKYIWSQNNDDITIKCELPEEFMRDGLKIDCKQNVISVTYNDIVLLTGKLLHCIDTNLTTWTTTNNLLEISLSKSESGLMWPELIENDKSGEYLTDPSTAEEIHARLSHLCADTEQNCQNGATFNSQQVEECDFVDDKPCLLERISCTTHEVTHRIHLGTHPCLLSIQLQDNLPPALGLKHDVDVCLWQPQETDDWELKHVGTLLAFGYVQASKSQRKFLAAAQDLRYAIVCESSRHIFVYCQNKPVTSGLLRNRTTGNRINTIAEQRVLTVPGGDILGVYPCSSGLYVLTTEMIVCFKL